MLWLLMLVLWLLLLVPKLVLVLKLVLWLLVLVPKLVLWLLVVAAGARAWSCCRLLSEIEAVREESAGAC